MMIIFFTLPAAGVSVAVSSQQILAAYAIFILVPAATSWGLQYPSQTATVLGLTALYSWFIISVAGDGEQLNHPRQSRGLIIVSPSKGRIRESPKGRLTFPKA